MSNDRIIRGPHSGHVAARPGPRCIALIVVLAAALAGQSAAQTFTTLYNFGGSDGAYPRGDLALSDGTVYGTTVWGGSSWVSDPLAQAFGNIFAINTDGTGFQSLYSFSDSLDGANPVGGVVLSGSTLYGTTEDGGNPGGTVFSATADGTAFTALYDFTTPDVTTNNDGASPFFGLLLSGSTLYGVTSHGGTSGNGVVFSVNVDGSGFTTVHSFTTNEGSPSSEVVLSGGTLFGATSLGGRWGSGTIYALSTDGKGFTNLYSFTAALGNSNSPTNADGAGPSALVLSGTRLCGTTTGGGTWGNGTVFSLDIDGTGFRTLHTFTESALTLSGQAWGPNGDGSGPRGLILSGNSLYGVAGSGGSSGNGTVFSLNTDGTGFATLHSFSARTAAPCPCTNHDGWIPAARLVLSGNTLYGTTWGGGVWGYGTVFSIALPPTPPRLALSLLPGNVILTWPTNATGFTLESTTNLVAPVWTTNSSPPMVINGLNRVTNPNTGPQQFYRLCQ